MKNLIRFDWAVKRLLRNKANFGILEGFLSELLSEDIQIESILESESNKQTGDNKSNRVDILVKNSKDELLIIEIQNSYMLDYLMRMLFGTSKLIVDNMDEGMKYGNIKKIISVNIVYFDLGRGEDYIYHGTTNYVGIHKNDTLTLSKNEESIYHTEQIAKIYPEYYIIKVNQFDEVAKDRLDEWVYFLKNSRVKEGSSAKGLKEAQEKLDVLKLSEADKREYDNYIKDWRDTFGVIVGNFDKGKFEGHQEGRQEGIEEGRQEGRLESRYEIAKNCLAEGMPVTVITKLTGLSEDEIRQIVL